MTIRAFIAVELDEALKSSLAAAQQSLKAELSRAARGRSDVRVQWVKPEAMHLTLRFLGDIEQDAVAPIGEALVEVAGRHERLAVPVGGFGLFPDARAPRVLWVGLRDARAAEAVTGCAADLDAALERLGFARERRPFSPHLTLARIKDGGREIGRALAETGALAAPSTLGTLEVRALALMRSDLRPAGSIYTKLREAALR